MTLVELHPDNIATLDWQLSSQQWEQLQQVIDGLNDTGPATPEVERRGKDRSRFVLPVRLCWGNDQQHAGSMWAMAHNLSNNGMGLVARRMFRIGERLTVELPMPDNSTRRIHVTIAFCRYISNMYHDVGLRFVRNDD